MKNENIEKLLNYDAIAEGENISGKHWSNFSESDMKNVLINNYLNSKSKEKCLKYNKDTYFQMSWEYFINLLKENNFSLAYENVFKYNKYGDNADEKEVIYYNKEKGLVIYATSFYNCTSVNSGTLYGELQSFDTKEDREGAWKYVSTGGWRDFENRILETSHDIREGLFYKLNQLESHGKFLNKWTNKNRFLWFVNYIEEDEEGYNYKEITKNKIKQCPIEFQNILNRD